MIPFVFLLLLVGSEFFAVPFGLLLNLDSIDPEDVVFVDGRFFDRSVTVLILPGLDGVEDIVLLDGLRCPLVGLNVAHQGPYVRKRTLALLMGLSEGDCQRQRAEERAREKTHPHSCHHSGGADI